MPGVGSIEQTVDRIDAALFDREDPLKGCRDLFIIPDQSPIRHYFDGNSLHRPLIAARERVVQLIDEEWAGGLVRSWKNWIDLDLHIGNKIGQIMGAESGEVVVCNSTTVNLHNLVGAAIEAGAKTLITNELNFPTDRYFLQRYAKKLGLELIMFKNDPVQGPTEADVADVLSKVSGRAVITLSGVCYRVSAHVRMKKRSMQSQTQEMPL